MGYISYAIVLLPIFTGILIYLVNKKHSLTISCISQAIMLAMCLYASFYVRNAPFTFNLGGWAPPIGIAIRLDTISMAFVTLTAILYTLFLIYNSTRHYTNQMFYMLFLILEGMLIGIFILDDLFSIFIFVEVSTMVVALLIMHKHDSRSMYDGIIYLLVNIFSMTFYLFGIVMLYKIFGTFSLQLIRENITEVTNVRALFLPYSFIITAVSLKAALMPLFSWLPRAHGTPSSPSVVSAVLSGLYVKGGVYLFYRFTTSFTTVDVSDFFLICGVITALVGIILALSQIDLKLMLSYSTVSQLGLIMIGLNLGNEYSINGSLIHIINHAIFKATLFMCAGIIIETYRTRQMDKISGVFKKLPLVSVLLIFSMLGIAGFPFSSGSFSKYMLLYGVDNTALNVIINIINVGTIVIMFKLAIILFGDSSSCEENVVTNNRRGVLLTLLILFFVLSANTENLYQYIFGSEVHIQIGPYLLKSLVFFGGTALAYVLYKLKFYEMKLFEKIRKVDLGFNAIAMCIPIFNAVLFVYLLITAV